MCDKILNHYYDRDIGILPPLAWKRRFLGKLNEIMPKYIPMYRKLDTSPAMLNATDEY